MTGELHHIRHTLVPPNEHSQRLHSNAQGYLDKLNVGYTTQSRQPVAEMSRSGTFGNFIWDALEALALLSMGAFVGVMTYAYMMTGVS